MYGGTPKFQDYNSPITTHQQSVTSNYLSYYFCVYLTSGTPMGETTVVEVGGCLTRPVGIEGDGKGDGGFYGGWYGDGGIEAEGRCVIVDERDN